MLILPIKENLTTPYDISGSVRFLNIRFLVHEDDNRELFLGMKDSDAKVNNWYDVLTDMEFLASLGVRGYIILHEDESEDCYKFELTSEGVHTYLGKYVFTSIGIHL